MMEDNKEKLLNLLADEALFGLSDEESAELERLKKEFPEFENDDSFHLAAAINLTHPDAERYDPLPAHLQAKILSDADKFFSPAENEQKEIAFNLETKAEKNERGGREAVETKSKIPWWGWLGWGVAAAACLALAVNLWLTRGTLTPEVVQNPPGIQTPTPAAPSPRPLSPAEERERLLASARDLVQTSWIEPDPKKAKQITGDIVWSNSEQKGFLRFRNLPVNDPNRETYQLWIFDENQSDKTPIDGGVFDAAANGEIVVSIDAKIKVKKPVMFAVTVEKPGGVVVSDRRRLVTIAKI